MRCANYVVEVDTPYTFIIRDVGPWHLHPTVTNDAEQVVKEIAPRLNGRKLLYYDSEDDLSELVVKDGRFAGFAPVPKRSAQ